MKLIADFHIHSRFSRATSKELTPEEIDYWAKIKGLSIVGTGDFTHPKWRAELKEKLDPVEPGLYRLKEKFRIKDRMLPAEPGPVRFVFSAEISCIYKKAGSVRKLHHLILAPSLPSAEQISKTLSRIGNLNADGRPILGMDSKDLLSLVLESDEQAVLIPAHIWTPWFSLFGSMSGFDAIEDCFEDLTGQIFALETGLSSDPAMNWRLSSLDRFSLVSNSDAHSAKNLAREANIFDCAPDYFQMMNALRDPAQGYLGTVEFFPQEGKYHYDGHRKCGLRFSPKETKKHQGLCPVCKKPLTIGVMNRVDALADRDDPNQPSRAPGFKSLIPLAEVLGEILDIGPQSRAVEKEYFRLVSRLGPELKILLDAPISEIEKEFPALALAAQRMRQGEVKVEPGYDGEYGRIKVFAEQELKELARGQDGFFAESVKDKEKSVKRNPEEDREEVETFSLQSPEPERAEPIQLDPFQKQAVESKSRVLLIKAGPGTGKTRTLTLRIADLIEHKIARPAEVAALTFTNQAAREMQTRLQNLLGQSADQIAVSTIHSFAYRLIRDAIDSPGKFSILDEEAKMALLNQIAEQMASRNRPAPSKSKLKKIAELISKTKNYLISPEELRARGESAKILAEIYRGYQARLLKENCLDYDDLIFRAVKILREPKSGNPVRERFRFIFVDEYQDLDFGQYQLVKLLAGESGTLCVIGDPNQSIYGFRGASPEFFLRFQEDWPEAEIIELEKCFRSSDQILKAAHQILCREKEMRLCSGISGPNTRIIELATERAEAEFIIHEIEKLIGGTGFFSFDSARVKSAPEQKEISFSDLAVLFRTGGQIPALVEAFSRSGIPYQALAESPLKSKFFRTGLWLIQILSQGSNPLLLKLALLEIFPAQKSLPQNPAELEKWLETRTGSEPAQSLLELVRNSGELSALEICDRAFALAPAEEDETAEKEMVKELVLDLIRREMKETGIRTASEIWETLKMASAQDFYDPRADRVSLLTIHSAKGLEFETVFIVGVEEGLIPIISAQSTRELSEELRLLYVAVTRAKSRLYLLSAKKRVLRGTVSEQKPSRFLRQIESSLLDQLIPEPFPLKPRSKQLGLFEK